MRYSEVLRQFKLKGNAVSAEPYGEGHINETNLVTTDTGAHYILQKINNKIFTDVNALMRNIYLVTAHLEKKAAARGEEYCGLKLIRTKNGENFCNHDGEYYRVYDYINTTAMTYQIITEPRLFYETAVGFANFQNELADFDATLLADVLPNFHNTVKRFENFTKSLKADRLGRAKDVQKEIDFGLEREKYCDRIVSLLESGKMPLRVTHNDTKLNNVLLDRVTGKAVAVIDFDTIMQGSSCYDFGDAIRFGCNSAAEDEPDLSKVYFRMDLYKLYTEGYLSVLKSITGIEREQLAFSAILMTLECGMRFLSDYLDGDVYFRVRRENHNLYRARTQFKLVSDMEKVFDEMQDFTLNCGK
jgi:thiamine kinase-like enzyme